MILKLENTTTHQIYEYEVKDMNNGEKLYFRFDIDTSNLVDGEYILSLYDGEKLVANDLLKIGDFNANTLQYKKGENIYIDVTLDNSVQGSKSVVIETTYTTITPDDGFNSMGKVDVNAQPLYDNAYHIGHTEGYNEGLESSYQVGYDDGYSIGNEDGYNNGYSNGNADGIEEGKAAQKALLEPITITENGTYTKEDGYNSIEVNVPDLNGSYDEGYSDGYLMGEDKGYEKGYDDGIEEGTSNAGEIIAQTAQVLNITENGVYMSRYSDIPTPDVITGVYPDGTEFYNYAKLSNKVFNTGIAATKDTRLEFWYKGDDTLAGDAFNLIIGAAKNDDSNCYQLRYNLYSNTTIMVELDYNTLTYTWDENAWHHILIAKETEDASVMSLWVDEIKVGDFGNTSFYPQSTFYINGIEYDLGGQRRANGCFGMIKIDDTIIIPTADGFRNTNTGELLEVAEEGIYIFTDNTPQVPEGNLIKTVNVNIVPTFKFEDYGLKCSYSTFKTLPSWIDLNGVIDCSYMFRDSKIEEAPYFDTSITTNMQSMFHNCFYITGVPLYYTKNCNNLSGMFTNAGKLQTIPNFELGTNVNLSEFLYGCKSLTSFPKLDTKGVSTMQNMFYSCTSLTEIPALDASGINVSSYNSASLFGATELKNITKAGGLLNLRRKIDDNYGWVKTPNLDYESCINILNGLYDFTGNGVTPTSNEGKLKVHKNFLDAVGDKISIGTNKGWTITN